MFTLPSRLSILRSEINDTHDIFNESKLPKQAAVAKNAFMHERSSFLRMYGVYMMDWVAAAKNGLAAAVHRPNKGSVVRPWHMEHKGALSRRKWVQRKGQRR